MVAAAAHSLPYCPSYPAAALHGGGSATRHAPVETPNSYWDMSGFGTAAHADAESEGLAKSPTPKSLLPRVAQS